PQGMRAERPTDVCGREARKRVDHAQGPIWAALGGVEEVDGLVEVGALVGRAVKGRGAGGHRVLPATVAVEAAGQAWRGPAGALAGRVPALRLAQVGSGSRSVICERQRGGGLPGDVATDPPGRGPGIGPAMGDSGNPRAVVV